MKRRITFIIILIIAASFLLTGCNGGSLNLKTMIPIADKDYVDDTKDPVEDPNGSGGETPTPSDPAKPNPPVVEKDPEYITFGSYPTSVVDTSSQLYQDLLSCYKTGSNTFQTLVEGNVTYYTDGTIKYFPYLVEDIGSATANGYVKDAVYFFVVEPIRWRILDETSQGYFVMSERLIDGYCFDLQLYSTNWEECTLRSYLNSTFYNMAFTTSEKNKIVKSDVINKGAAYPVYEVHQGPNTVDNVYLLSYADCFNPEYGFLVSTTTADAAKQAQATDFCKAKGVLVSNDTQFYNNGEWWTRSTGFSKSSVSCIDIGGCISFMGRYVNLYYGIRPAMIVSSTVQKDA